MIERVIDKKIVGRNMVDVEARIKYAKKSGYELVGDIVQLMDGGYHCLMRKTIVWEKRK